MPYLYIFQKTFSLKRMFELSNRGENPAGEVIAQLTKVISLCILIALAISLLVKSSRASRERFLGVQVIFGRLQMGNES